MEHFLNMAKGMVASFSKQQKSIDEMIACKHFGKIFQHLQSPRAPDHFPPAIHWGSSQYVAIERRR